jgi:hypothetical protein
LTCPSFAFPSHRAVEAADLSASIFEEINRRAVTTRWTLQPPPTNQSPQHLRAAKSYYMANIPCERVAVGGAAAAQLERLLPFVLFILFIIFYSMLTPYPSFIPVLSTSTTGRTMIASRARRRRFAQKIMRNRANAEALPIFSSAGKWRGNSRAWRRWRRVQSI